MQCAYRAGAVPAPRFLFPERKLPAQLAMVLAAMDLDSKGSILVIDDHADTRTVLARILTRDGYQVKSAGTKAEALELCLSESFDLLIVDLELPDGDGADLMREVAETCGFKGIAYSGHGSDDRVEHAREAGFSAFLLKPVGYDVLRKTVLAVLGECEETRHSFV